MTSNYTAEITTLKREISTLETKLTTTEVKLDLWMEFAKGKEETIKNIQQRNQWLKNRNKQLENPRGSHYHSLSWQGKAIFCIRKLKRPLRLQEISQELEIMEAKTEGLNEEGDNFSPLCWPKR